MTTMINKKNPSYFGMFKWIYSSLPKYRKNQTWILFLGMITSSLFETFSLMFIAFFASAVTDPSSVLTSKYIDFIKLFVTWDYFYTQKGLIVTSAIVVTLLVAVKNIIRAIVNYGVLRFSVGIEAFFGEQLLKGFLTLPYMLHLNFNTADLVNSVQWRTFFGRAYYKQCLQAAHNIIMVTLLLMGLFLVQPAISFLVIVCLGSSAWFIFNVIKKKIDEISTIARDYHIEINKEVTMAIHGIKDVKVYQRENLFVNKFLNKAIPLAKIYGVQGLYSQSPVQILEFVGFAMLALSICIMILFFNVTIAYITGTISLLAVAAWKILPAVNEILASLTGLRKSIPYIESQKEYFNIIEHENDLSQGTNGHEDFFKFTQKIEFDKVCFSYQDAERVVLKDVSFNIKKGQTVGIIGASGSGKSTLIDLAIGLFEPVEGSILIDDQVLNRVNQSKWFAKIGYVSQAPYIYDGSLSQNVAFGQDKDSIDNKKVYQCCMMAAMGDFIDELPNGVETEIGERGIKLSGGQKQRVAIARALYDNPEIMIFDEATSSLDTKSEKSIQKTIYSFKGKQTLIIVAHRLGTVKDCDKLIWVEKGEIKMHGETRQILKEYRKKMNVQ